MKQSDIEGLAVSVGLTPTQAATAAAVAMAESGGNPKSHNTNTLTGDNSYGLWQINMLGDLGPDRRRRFGITSNDQLFDPQTNARAMAILSSGGSNFDAWSTVKRGDYKRFLSSPAGRAADAAQSGVAAVGGAIGDTASNLTAGVDTVTDTVAKAGQVLVKATAWASNAQNWVRVGYVVGGGVLVAVVIGKLAAGTPVGQAASKITKKVAATAAVA